jgi:Domain of unknown function (DUF4386)
MTVQVQTIQLNEVNTEIADSKWTWLYKIGGAAALLSVVFFPIQIAIFMINPPPDSVIGWFSLFQSNQFIGLLDLDLLLVADQVLAILILLALYIVLKRVSESFMAIGVVLGLVAATLFIASNPAFEMLSLSKQYAIATTEAQKTILLAAGQAMLATWQGSAFQVSYLLGSIALILISAVMLRSKLFSNTIAYLGILANVIALGLYVPKIGVYISVFSVVFLWVWNILIARRLFQLGRTVQADE